jgi:hypothetical protein
MEMYNNLVTFENGGNKILTFWVWLSGTKKGKDLGFLYDGVNKEASEDVYKKIQIPVV